ncbi:MAG: 4Fe-4S dicluster domain-containing protein [Bacteroidales bacterium]|nr:4Fe-4S dicluster domain-containing protein [Bacteroidales bacterium]
MIVLYIFLLLLILALLMLFIPLKGKSYSVAVAEKHRDERDTMFSRNEIQPGEKSFDDYYRMRPANREKDDLFRAEPGLLDKGSRYYNRYAFACAEAGFDTVELFYSARKGEEGGRGPDEDDDPARLTAFIKNWASKLGALDTGVTLMRDYHFYTYGGRGGRYGKEVINDHKFGIALTVEMDHELTGTGPQAPVVMESAHQYLQSAMVATQLAVTLRKLGYSATTHIDANYDVICPLVARDAGLGEIGRMGLLMTPKHGPRVRIAVITTDAPLLTDKSGYDNSVIDFCAVCKKCARVCPSASIPFGSRENHRGGLRWQINQESCFTYWCRAGTDCGRCMAVCPYSHKNNAVHNFVRWGIRNNFIFRRLAVRLDDLFYGSKPKPTQQPSWLRSYP